MRKLLILMVAIWFCPKVSAQNPAWDEFEPVVKASLRGLSPVSSKICWASGSNGTWLKTTDGGQTWESGLIGGLDTVDFRSIHAWDAQTAIAASAGQPAVIYRTSNGGKSWEKVHQEGSEAFFDAISFSDKKNGYVLGDPLGGKWMVLETKDGGVTWKSMDPLPEAVPGEAAFAASSSSLIASREGIGFATGGSVARWHYFSKEKGEWIHQELPEMAQGEPSKGVFAVVKVKDYLVMVGGDYTLLDSQEGNSVLVGDWPNRVPKKLPLGYRSGIAFGEKMDLLVAVGPSGADFSRDFGYTWESLSDRGFHSVKIAADGQSIWASGSGGRLAKLKFFEE